MLLVVRVQQAVVEGIVNMFVKDSCPPPEKNFERSQAFNQHGLERLICSCRLLYNDYTQLLRNYQNLLANYQSVITYNHDMLNRYICRYNRQAAHNEADMFGDTVIGILKGAALLNKYWNKIKL